MDPMSPPEPTDPTVAETGVDGAAGAPATATTRRRRFLNRTTGTLVAVGLLGAVLGGGAVALAGGVTNGDGGGRYEHHDGRMDPDAMRDRHWGRRDGRSFGPGGPMMHGGPPGGPWGGQQGGQWGGQPQGDQQGTAPQSGPGGGMMQGGDWGPQGMTRGS
jgi:hypothetical protein